MMKIHLRRMKNVTSWLSSLHLVHAYLHFILKPNLLFIFIASCRILVRAIRRGDASEKARWHPSIVLHQVHFINYLFWFYDLAFWILDRNNIYALVFVETRTFRLLLSRLEHLDVIVLLFFCKTMMLCVKNYVVLLLFENTEVLVLVIVSSAICWFLVLLFVV